LKKGIDVGGEDIYDRHKKEDQKEHGQHRMGRTTTASKRERARRRKSREKRKREAGFRPEITSSSRGKRLKAW